MRTFLFILLLSFAGGASAEKRLASVRPITLKVIDARTKEPLNGISVYYAIQTIVFQKYIFLIIPNLEPDIGPKIAYKEHKYTNERGEVAFQVNDFSLPKNERLDKELIFINLSVDMAQPRAQDIQSNLQYYYSTGRVRRSGPVDLVDVMDQIVFTEDMAGRNKYLILPNPKYRAIQLISLESAPHEGFQDWTRPGDKFNVRYNFSSLGKDSDSVVIELERYGQSRKF